MIKNTITLIDHILMSIDSSKINVAVDMTAGNGYDTKKILDILKPRKMYCFDVQEDAKNNTLARVGNRINFILDSHANIDSYITDSIDIAIYNLGYLPGSNHSITTTYSEVIKSLKATLTLLSENGYILITIYPGHDEGYKEKVEVENFLRSISQKEYTIIKYDFINQINNPPYVISIYKI